MLARHKVLAERRANSDSVLSHARKLLLRVKELQQEPRLCIYATGSYARREASRHSDLDVFLVHSGAGCSQIQRLLISGELIRICRSLALPEFSNDGQYLAIHSLDDIRSHLGSPQDDFGNYFTARMLLLLESTPLCHKKAYDRIVAGIIESYYRDYHDHESAFRPIFLANDIIRFWKTLCLNYEHKRNRPAAPPAMKRRSHLKNLKLKFSRMTTCFSGILLLVRSQSMLTPDQLLDIIRQPPLERLCEAAGSVRGGRGLLRTMLDDYAWFLEQTGRPEAEVLTWMGQRGSRDDAFGRARRYGASMFELLLRTAGGNARSSLLRYLVI